VASRDRLLLLRRNKLERHPPHIDLRVCDVLTGHVTDLPPVYLPFADRHVFLRVGDGDARASFDLLVIDDMLFQTFSAEEGRWGAVRDREASLLSDHPHPVERLCTSSPAVIGRTVYWSCCSTVSDCWDKILALDVDEAKETLMKLPPGCFWFCKVNPRKKDSRRLLLASVRGRLSLLVSELTGITMWTLTPASSSSAAT
jgi:hypothetical protein